MIEYDYGRSLPVQDVNGCGYRHLSFHVDSGFIWRGVFCKSLWTIGAFSLILSASYLMENCGRVVGKIGKLREVV